MKIMAIDPATVLGFAMGRAGTIPDSGSVRLKRRDDTAETAAFNALCFLRDRWTLERPDLCCIEHYLNPAAQKSADAVILQIMVFGVIVAMCQAYGVRFEMPHRATVLKHFCGKGRTGDRVETKRMVINRAKVLGYIPRDCIDDNRADACALFDFASVTYARQTPERLVLFGAQA